MELAELVCVDLPKEGIMKRRPRQQGIGIGGSHELPQDESAWEDGICVLDTYGLFNECHSLLRLDSNLIL